MQAIIYGIILQFKMDMRSKTLLVTCYVVPLLFFAIMGSIFTNMMPDAKNTLIASMSVMGISMGALIGVPPSLVEIYGSDIKKMYHANGVPLYMGLLYLVISACIHLMIMSGIIFISAYLAFDAVLPQNIPLYFIWLLLFVIVSLSVACVLGLMVKDQAKLTMYSQIVFLPSIMLSGIMFSAQLLPSFLETLGKIFPATWGYTLLLQNADVMNSVPLLVMFGIAFLLILFLLKKTRTE